MEQTPTTVEQASPANNIPSSTPTAEVSPPSKTPAGKKKKIVAIDPDIITLPDGREARISELPDGELLWAGALLIISLLINKKNGKRRFLVEGPLPEQARKPGEGPRLRKRKKTFTQAQTYALQRELDARGMHVEKEMQPTSLKAPWLRVSEAAYEKLKDFPEGPAIVTEAVDFFLEHHSGRNKDITMLELLEALIQAKATDRPVVNVDNDVIVCANGRTVKKRRKKAKRKRSKRTVAGWKAGVYAITSIFGTPTGRTNRFGHPICDMKASDVTEERLIALDDVYETETAQCYINRISAVLQHGVDKGHLEHNRAYGIVLEEDKNDDEANKLVAVLNNEQVQRGLNMAARIYDRKALPLFVLAVGGGLRPDAELPFFSWDRVDWGAKAVRVYSSKTGETRIMELAANWLAILRWAYDQGIQPEFSVSAWGAIRMAMGYWDERCPQSLWPEGFEEFDPWTADLYRHTACSNRQRYQPDIKENARWAGNSIEVFGKHYSNGTITVGMAAQYYNLGPDIMRRTPAIEADIKDDLIKHNLIRPGEDLPQHPAVPQIHLRCPKAPKIPTIPDKELEKMIWDTSLTEVAEKLGLNRLWLSGYCRAKQIRLPPQCNKRENRVKLEDVPLPPPFVTISDQELHDRIWAKMSVEQVAHSLGIYPTWLRIYCQVRGIDYPDRKRFARQKAIAAAQRTFRGPPDEVKRVLKEMPYQDAAVHFGVRVDAFLRYCRKNNIEVPGYKFFRRKGQYQLELKPANPANQTEKAGLISEAKDPKAA